MNASQSTPDAVGRDSPFNKVLSWFYLALIAVISCLSIPQIVFLDSAFTKAKNSDRPLLFADYARLSPGGPVVSDYRYAFGLLAVAMPLCSVGAMFLRGWIHNTVLVVSLVLSSFIFFYVGAAIISAT